MKHDSTLDFFSLDMTTQNMVSIKTVLSIRKTGCRLLRYTSFNNNLGNEVELEQSTQKNNVHVLLALYHN